jgi:hypothetical protein
MTAKITAVFHLAYDWMLAGEAIGRIADYVDRVLIVSDSDLKTWTLRDFAEPQFDYMINQLVNRGIKTEHIEIAKFPFHNAQYNGEAMVRLQHLPHITKLSDPLRRETLQRNWASLQVEQNHWVLQLDGDEWIEQPKMFCAWLRDQQPHIVVGAPWFNVWKRVESGFLIVAPQTMPKGNRARIATQRRGDYKVSRAPARGTEVVSPFSILHWTLAGRGGRLGLEEKLKGWGLMTETEADLFINAWEKIDETNYQHMDWITPSRKPGYGNQKLILVTKADIAKRFGPADFEECIPEWKD